MKRNNKNISREDFRRYLENQMTNAERNAFERDLQKNPLEAEALEGFQQIPTADLENDLKELSRKIISAKKKNNTRFWAAAATFLLLVSVGIIWFQLKEKTPVPEITEVKTIQKEEDKALQTETQNQKINESVVEEDKTSTNEIKEEPLAKKVTKQVVSEPAPIPENEEKIQIQIPDAEEIQPIQIAEIQKEDETSVTSTKVSAPKDNQIRIRGYSAAQKSAMPGVNLAVNKMDAGAGTARIIKGKVISLDDSLPLPGVTIVEKGTENGTISNMDGNFTLQLFNISDSVLVANFIGMEETEFSFTGETYKVIGLEPSQLALNEVVAIGYGTRNDTNETETIINAQPKNGMNNFKKYVVENAVLPNDYPEKRVVVRVALRINLLGNIISVENKNNSDSKLFEKAKQILLNGPEWNPETINGIPVESEVTLRIIFRKE